MTKNGQKWLKNKGFWTLLENQVVSFIWNWCKTELAMVHYDSVKTACLGKIRLSYSQKWLSANEISVFFDEQYLINRLISDFDFWIVHRH